MKLSIRQITDGLPAIQKIAKVELPIKAAYALHVLLEQVGDKVKFFEDKRNALITKHGSKNKDGAMSVDVKSDGYKPFVKAINEVLDYEIEIKFEPLSIEDLNISLTTAEFITVKHFFKQ